MKSRRNHAVVHRAEKESDSIYLQKILCPLFVGRKSNVRGKSCHNLRLYTQFIFKFSPITVDDLYTWR